MSLNSEEENQTTSKSNLATDISSFEEYITCMICFELVSKPRECEVCHKVYCYDCLLGWLKNKDTLKCPLKCDGKMVSPDVIIGDIFKTLQFYCKNRLNGCEKVLYSSEIKKHDIECTYKMVLCPNNYCSHRTFRINLKKHLRRCNFQRLCPYCKKEIVAKKFPFHRKICKFRDVSCKLCHKYFTYTKYCKHISTCKEKYLNIVCDLQSSKMLCGNCLMTDGVVVCNKLERMKGCHICNNLFCTRCFIVDGIQCIGCQKVTCEIHLKKCRICKLRKCKNCVGKCTNCNKGSICVECLFIETTGKTYCARCRKCACCREVFSGIIDKSCFYCKYSALCNNCLVCSSVSNKLICKNKCIYCNACDFKFHELELIKIIMVLNLKLKTDAFNLIAKRVIEFISCQHTLQSYKGFCYKMKFNKKEF